MKSLHQIVWQQNESLARWKGSRWSAVRSREARWPVTLVLLEVRGLVKVCPLVVLFKALLLSCMNRHRSIARYVLLTAVAVPAVNTPAVNRNDRMLKIGRCDGKSMKPGDSVQTTYSLKQAIFLGGHAYTTDVSTWQSEIRGESKAYETHAPKNTCLE